jgi:hypothetical protein
MFREAQFVTSSYSIHKILPFPTVQLPSNVSDIAPVEIDGHFIVHVGQVPIVLTTDFVPE